MMILTRTLAIVATTAVLLSGAAWPQVSDFEARLAEGMAARQAGRVAEAVEILTPLAAESPQNADVAVQLGFALLATDRLDEAEDAFRRALSVAPDYADANLGLGQIAFRRGAFAEAVEQAEVVLASREDPEARDLVERANAAQQAEEDEKVAEARPRREEPVPRRAAPERAPPAPDPVAPLFTEARSLRQAGRFAEAEAVYACILERNARNAEALVEIGLVQGFQQEFAEARASFERALAVDPAARDARLGLARLDLWAGQLDSAAARIAALIAERPDDLEARNIEARIFLAGGRTAEARRAFEAVLARDPGNVEALVGLGDAARAEGDETAARTAYQRALAIEPGSADVAQRLSAPAARVYRWRIDADGAYSRLTMGFEDWIDASFRVGYQIEPGTNVSVATEVSRRFGLVDQYLETRLDQRLDESLSIYVLFGGTPEADYRPAFAYAGGFAGTMRQSDGLLATTILTLDAARAHYTDNVVGTVSPGLVQYLFDGNVWITARWINIFDPQIRHEAGYSLRGDVQINDDLVVFGGYADAPDSTDGEVIRSRSVFGGASLAV